MMTVRRTNATIGLADSGSTSAVSCSMTAKTMPPTIAPIEHVESTDEALRRANDSEFGLSVGVFTESLRTAERFIDGLEAGAVNVNDASSNWEPHTPVGGYTGKRSGVGRYGGRFTIEGCHR